MSPEDKFPFSSDFFVERPALDRELQSKLLSDYIVAISGASGSGKSSLIQDHEDSNPKRGIIHRLTNNDIEGQAGTSWRTVNLSPAADPVGRLARELAKPNKLIKEGQVPEKYDTTVERKLRNNVVGASVENNNGASGLLNLYRETIHASDESFNLLIVVDQLEELIRFEKYIPKGDDLLFINLLMTAARSQLPIYIIFLFDLNGIHSFSRYRGLPEIINNHRLFVPNINAKHLDSFFQKKANNKTEKKLLQFIIEDFKDAQRIRSGKNVASFAIYSLKKKLEKAHENWEAFKQDKKFEFEEKELIEKLRPLVKSQQEDLLVTEFITKPQESLLRLQKNYVERLRRAFQKNSSSKTTVSINEHIDISISIQKLLENVDPITVFKREHWYLRQVEILGREHVKGNGIGDILKYYFENTFTASASTLEEISRILNEIESAENFENLPELKASLKEAEETWGQSQWKRKLIASYKGLPPMHDFLSITLEKKFRELSPKAQRTSKFIFQALTELGSKDQVHRIPRKLTELQILSDRRTSSTNDVADLINNELSHVIYSTNSASTEKVPSELIIDISSEATTQSWSSILKWAQLENVHSNAFISIVKDGIAYLESGQTPKPKRPFQDLEEVNNKSLNKAWKTIIGTIGAGQNNSTRNKNEHIKSSNNTENVSSDKEVHLYEGQQLYSLKDWFDERQPNEAWAVRYLPEFQLTTNHLQRIKELPIQKSGQEVKTNLDFARWFLELSQSMYFDAKEAENKIYMQRERRANRLKNWAIVGVIAALVLMGVAGWKWNDARIANQNIELIDFVEILNYNNIIYYSPERKDEFGRQMEGLTQRVADDKHIKNNVDVLQFLNKHGYIHVREGDMKISFEALESIDKLYDGLRDNTQAQRKKKRQKRQRSIKELTSSVLPIDTDLGFKQYPYLYYALKANREVSLNGQTGQAREEEKKQSLIEQMASAINNDSIKYAYGDKNGKVFIKRINENNSKPYFVNFIGMAGSNVKALHFDDYQNGKVLYAAGADSDTLVRFNWANRPGVAEAKTTRHSLQVDGEIQYIANTAKEETLLIMGKEKLFLYEQKVTGENISFRQTHSFIIPDLQGSIRSYVLSPDHKYLWIGSKHESLVIEINPSASSTSNTDAFKEKLRIKHPGITISEIGVKGSNDNFWLALGGELGDIWICKEDIVQMKSIDITDSVFTHFKLHGSTITGLHFNPVYPQLASSSLDGYIRLWNLANLKKDLENSQLNNSKDKLVESVLSDQIKLKFNGQGVWKITYVNGDELAGAENIKTKLWKTNIEAFNNELDIDK